MPDLLTRAGIRMLVQQRRRQIRKQYRKLLTLKGMLVQMKDSPLAINTLEANEQHYNVSTDFFDLVLGEHKKYSSALFDASATDLSEAEAAMLKLTCERAQLDSAKTILELGCGWGALTLWMAEQYPDSKIVALGNSESQKAYIDSAAEKRDLANIEVICSDMNDFNTEQRFDRIVSIEMFEHMRNHELLFERIASWLEPEGKLFFQIFCHQTFPYFFESESESDWLATNFFSGGMMPSWDLPLQFQAHLSLEDRWPVNGTHYAQTCATWLVNCDRFKPQILEIFVHSPDHRPPIIQFNRWRMFFMACETLFAYNQGHEWFIGHYLFNKQ
ncbi:cyclopropane-fatty-acyl-phospholipid synthase family protein [Pseudomonadales bacterium]|nr:cyclopropane-fatty-acyl-phospholipid synthase family protein [Pseudomonadales bacterium]